MTDRVPFSGNPLDRAANQRREDGWIEEHLASDGSRYLPFWRMNPLVSASKQAELLWLDRGIRRHLGDEAEPLLLGLKDGVAHFATDVSALENPVAALGLDGAEFADARGIALDLPEGDAGILSQARALLEWHRRHRFCGSCGAPTNVGAGGGMRRCTTCEAEHFPNPHPVVIMVVWRGNRCLLGRGRRWAEERYSALAGFMDEGETIEEAVAREVFEEVGLEVDGVAYHSSQPWPFPSSLMIGCFAHVTGEAVNVDPVELAGARWFERGEIRNALAEPASVSFGLPGRIAIAHRIITAWSQQELGEDGESTRC